MAHVDFAQCLAEAKPVFRQRWQTLVEQSNYKYEVASFTAEVRRRHTKLWEQLMQALKSDEPTAYLLLVEQEGRCQARAQARLESVVIQLCEMMNLIWEILSCTSSLQEDPVLLLEFTKKLNLLRSLAEAAMLKGFQEENRVIQEELTAESAAAMHLRLQQTDLVSLIRSIPAFRVHRYKLGQLIFQPGDDRSVLYFLLDGRVRLYELLADGRSISLSLLNEQDVFAQSNDHASYFHDVYAEAMTSVMVAQIQQPELLTLLENAPLVGSRIINSFSQQLWQSQQLIQGLLGRDVTIRLVRVLLKLAQEFGKPDVSGSVFISLNLTHQELADMIGSNRVTVTRKLIELQEKQLISISHHNISIINLPHMTDLAA